MKNLAAKALVILILTSFTLSSCGVIIINDRKPDTDAPPSPLSGTEAVGDSGVSSDTGAATDETASDGAGYTPYDAPDYKAQAQEMLEALPGYDFGGIAVTIAATAADSYVPASGDTEVNAARLRRNALFEKKYNTRLICTVYDKAELLEQAKLALLSDSYLADLISIPMSELGAYVSADILMNLRSLPFTDYTAPYFNGDAVTAASAGDATWATLGEANRNDYHLYCVYFNRDLIAELALDDPYALVRSGEWTWDKMLELSKAAAALDGIAGMGSSLSAEGCVDLFAASTGEALTDSGVGKIPATLALGERLSAAVGKLKGLLSSDGGYLTEPSAALSRFYDGGMLFFTERLTVAQWINDMKGSWGLLPLPKLDSSQVGYSGKADNAQPVFVVLSHNANVESTAHFLQGYNAASYGYIAEEFKNTLMLRTLRDNSSVEMLDYVTSNVNYDFAFMFGGAYPTVASATYQALRDAVLGAYSLESLVKSRAPYMAAKMSAVFRLYAG